MAGTAGTCINEARAVNDLGDAVGLAYFPGSQAANTSHMEAFYWHAGSLLQLPAGDSSLHVFGNGTCSDGINYIANDINASGTAVGWAYFKDPNPANQDDRLAAEWPAGAGAPTSLGLLPSATPAKCFSEAPSFVSEADAINAGGDITGNSTFCTASGFAQYSAVLIPHGGTLATSGQVIAPPTLGGIATGIAINSSDQVVVNQQPSANPNATESDLWSKSGNTTKQLPFVASFWSNVLNDSGVVVGTDNNLPVYSVNAGGEKHLTPAGGLPNGYANGVNADGDVVGYSFGNGKSIATLWPVAVAPATGTPPPPIDLQTLLPAGSPTLVGALAISKNGTILASSDSGYQILVPGGQRISGRVTDPESQGIGTVQVEVKGTDSGGHAIDKTFTTDPSGAYLATLDPGTYTVTPHGTGPQASTEFTPGRCDGTKGTDSCAVPLAKDQSAVADFTGSFSLGAKVKDETGAGTPGVTVQMQRDGSPTDLVTAVTGADGTIKKDLGPGNWTVTALKKGDSAFFPVTSTDCVVLGTDCHVTLDRDRLVDFSSCVVPDPHGTPLPGSLATTGDIPGAKTFGSLEAVGCWKDEGDGKRFTSTQPVRLDGIDVQPAGKTTITLDPNGPHVSSDGPVTVWIDGIPAWKSEHFGMTFSGGAGGAVSDIESGSASTGITPNMFGWPINIGTGNPVGNNGGTIGVPWVFSPGVTTISLQGQVGPRFPSTMQAQWNFGDGKFERPGPNGQPEGVQSVALQGTVELTNRRGMKFGGCFAPFNDKQLKLFGADAGSLALAQICYDPNPMMQRWYGQALFELPADVGIVKHVNVQLSFQNIKASGAFDLRGYDLQALQFQLGGLGGEGIPLAESGLFLQRLGGGFQWDYSKQPPVLLTNVTAGISLGPRISLPFGHAAPPEAELLSADGKLEWSWYSDPIVLNMSGQLSVLHATPYEVDLGSGKVTYYFSNTSGKQGGRADIQAHGQLHLHVPFLGDVGGLADLTGFMVPPQPPPAAAPRQVQLEGNARFEFGGHFTTFNVLFANTIIGLCYHLSSGVEAGIYYDIVKGGKSPSGCDFTKFRLPTPAPPQVTPSAARDRARAAAAVVPGARGFRVGSRLKAFTIAVRGTTAAPRVVLAGPGTTIFTPPGGVRVDPRALVAQDAASHTTLITVSDPHRGIWTVAPLAGSSPIVSVLESTPMPRARITARTALSGCRERLTYRMPSAAGETVALYAQDGADRLRLGLAHAPRGSLRFQLDPAASRAGQIVASESRGGLPLGLRTLATFKSARANGTETPRRLRLKGRILTWGATCGTVGYQVKLARRRKAVYLHSVAARAKLPKLRGTYKITVTALGARDIVLGSATIKARL